VTDHRTQDDVFGAQSLDDQRSSFFSDPGCAAAGPKQDHPEEVEAGIQVHDGV